MGPVWRGQPAYQSVIGVSLCRMLELSDHFFTITSQQTCCPLQAMTGEDIVDLSHRRETPYKDTPLQYECSSHNAFVIQELCIGVDLKLPVDTPLVGLVGGWSGNLSWCA